MRDLRDPCCKTKTKTGPTRQRPRPGAQDQDQGRAHKTKTKVGRARPRPSVLAQDQDQDWQSLVLFLHLGNTSTYTWQAQQNKNFHFFFLNFFEFWYPVTQKWKLEENSFMWQNVFVSKQISLLFYWRKPEALVNGEVNVDIILMRNRICFSYNFLPLNVRRSGFSFTVDVPYLLILNNWKRCHPYRDFRH